MRGFDSSVGIRFSLQSRLFAWANAPPPALPRNSKSQHQFGNIGHACALSKQSPCHGAAVAGRKRTPFRGVDGADALQESASNDHSLVATMIGSDLEGCGPSQPLPAVNGHHFTAPAERTPSRGSASNDHSLVATMIGSGLEGCGPSQPLPAVNGHRFTAPRERTPSCRRRSSIRYPVAHFSDFFAPRGSGSHRADSIDNQTGTSTALGSWWHNTAEDPVGRSF